MNTDLGRWQFAFRSVNYFFFVLDGRTGFPGRAAADGLVWR
jgi:hypothetical protein